MRFRKVDGSTSHFSLTAAEKLAADLSAKTGLSLEVGYARVGPTAAASSLSSPPLVIASIPLIARPATNATAGRWRKSSSPAAPPNGYA